MIFMGILYQNARDTDGVCFLLFAHINACVSAYIAIHLSSISREPSDQTQNDRDLKLDTHIK